MTGRMIHYSEPVEFHKALPGANKLVLMKRVADDDDGFTPAVSRIEKPKNPTKPKSRLARNVAVDDEIGEAAEKGNNMTNEIDRGPYYKMIDRQALARQQQTGESYEKAFTACYTAPENIAIRDMAQYEHLAKSHDVMFGTRLSSIPVAKEAPAYDPLQKSAELAAIRGPGHARMHSKTVDYMRAHAGVGYSSAYSHEYTRPENAGLREKIKNEHLSATMAGVGDGVGKAAPADEEQDYVSPSARTPAAAEELDRLVVTRMKSDPKLSYERAFTYEYLAPANRSLKERYDAEGILTAQAREPAKPFPAYASPGQRAPSNLGRSGAKPRGYIGG
jgi:hypothetical protein